MTKRESPSLEDRLNFLAELSGMSRTEEIPNINHALGSGNWWLRPALDGAFYFRVWNLPEMRRPTADGWTVKGEREPIIVTGFASGDHYWSYMKPHLPRPEEGQVACFLTRPPRIRNHIDFQDCVPPVDRCPDVLLEILGALETPTFDALRAEAETLYLSEEAYDLLARRGIRSMRDARREVTHRMTLTLEAIRARPK